MRKEIQSGVILIFLVLFITNTGLSDSLFSVGEKLKYNIYAAGIRVGYQLIELKDIKKLNGREVYVLRGHSKTTPLVSLLYRLNDRWEILMDKEKLVPLRIEKDMVEGREKGFIVYEINQNDLTVTIHNIDKSRIKTVNAENPIFDFISMVYHFRSVAPVYNKEGDKITFDFLEPKTVRTVTFMNMGSSSLEIKQLSSKPFITSRYKQTQSPGIEFFVHSSDSFLPLKMEVEAKLARKLRIKIEVLLEEYRP